MRPINEPITIKIKRELPELGTACCFVALVYAAGVLIWNVWIR
jgi:hypothetical protein